MRGGTGDEGMLVDVMATWTSDTKSNSRRRCCPSCSPSGFDVVFRVVFRVICHVGHGYSCRRPTSSDIRQRVSRQARRRNVQKMHVLGQHIPRPMVESEREDGVERDGHRVGSIIHQGNGIHVYQGDTRQVKKKGRAANHDEPTRYQAC
jgi:hypothetical protein